MKPIVRVSVITAMACFAVPGASAQSWDAWWQGFGATAGDQDLLAQYGSALSYAQDWNQLQSYFSPQQSDKVRQQLERAREQAERVGDQMEQFRGASFFNIDAYARGQTDLNNRQYEKALQDFDRVIESKSSRSDGAMYWKAYAQNKLGRRNDALATLAELQKSSPKSPWISDAKALEQEVKQAVGQGVSPESETDEDLKLLAINSLINTDPERALPLLEKLLGEPRNSPLLKQRALFVLAQGRNPKAWEVVGRYAKAASNPDLQLKAVEYLGTYGSNDSRQILGDVYSSSTDPGVKRAVLRAYANGHDKERLLAAAKSEQNADLHLEAIRYLANAGGQAELAQLYPAETSSDGKLAIIRAMANSGNAEKLIDLARNEKEANLRLEAIRQLGNVRREKSAEALVSLYGSETDKSVKLQVVRALSNQDSAKQMVDLARKETDPELKKEIVRRLANMRSKEAVDYLMELLNK